MTEANLAGKKRPENVIGPTQSLISGLYLVATPIGNLRDITLRALDVLTAVDLILAEDTRHSRRLLDRYNIRTPMRPYHEHNADKALPAILRALEDGQALALISDAGTPLVSDPGYKLVQSVAKAGHRVIPIPGASAVLSALCGSGLPTDKFLFAGFAPAKTSARKKFFSQLSATPASLVFFEAPGRVLSSLTDMLNVFGPRPAVLARELTKIHEVFLRESLPDLIERISTQKTRGECVIVVGPPDINGPTLSDQQIDAALLDAMARSGVKQAAREVAEMSNKPMRDLYARALALKSRNR